MLESRGQAREAAKAAVEDGETVSGMRGVNATFKKMYERMSPYKELLRSEQEEKKAFTILNQRAKSYRFRNAHAVASSCAGAVLAALVFGVCTFTGLVMLPYLRSTSGVSVDELGVAQHSGRRLSSDVVGSLPSKCNWLNYQDDPQAGIPTIGDFGPVQLASTLQGGATSPANGIEDVAFYRTFRTEDTLAYANETIILSDSAQSSGEFWGEFASTFSSVFLSFFLSCSRLPRPPIPTPQPAYTSAPENVVAIQMVDYRYNFMSFTALKRVFESGIDLNTDRRLYNLYKKKQSLTSPETSYTDYDENMRVIEFGQLDPISFRINERDAQRCECAENGQRFCSTRLTF